MRLSLLHNSDTVPFPSTSSQINTSAESPRQRINVHMLFAMAATYTAWLTASAPGSTCNDRRPVSSREITAFTRQLYWKNLVSLFVYFSEVTRRKRHVGLIENVELVLSLVGWFSCWVAAFSFNKYCYHMRNWIEKYPANTFILAPAAPLIYTF